MTVEIKDKEVIRLITNYACYHEITLSEAVDAMLINHLYEYGYGLEFEDKPNEL